jgi:hypothetical protein
MVKQSGSIDNQEPGSARQRAADAELEARAKMTHRQLMAKRVANLVVGQIKLPREFVRVTGHHLFDDRYRVNVLAGKETPEQYTVELSIVASYFVVSNGLEIARSTPPLEIK